MSTTAERSSREARASINEVSLQQRVLNRIKVKGTLGATDDEVEVALGLTHQCASARRKELVDLGIVVAHPQGLRRPTRTGRKATCWVVADVPGTPRTPLGVEAKALLRDLRRATSDSYFWNLVQIAALERTDDEL